MANADNARGFVATRYLNGGNELTTNEYTIASGYSTSIFTGDPVKSSGTGKGIIIAGAADIKRGVFAGCSYVDSSGSPQFSKFWPASTSATDIVAHVYDDPNILFLIQGDEDVEAADIGATADLAVGAGGDVNTGASSFELDSSNIGTGANVLIYELDKTVGNAYGVSADVLVLLNEHELRGALTAT